jgi:chromatin remodeling complex protein RSC6
MVRKSDKSTPTPAPTVSEPAPVVEAPVKTASKKSSSKKQSAAEASTPAPVAVAPVVVAPVVAVVSDPASSPAVSGDSDSVVSLLNVFGAKLQQLAGQFSSIKTDFKLLEKQVSRKVKAAEKFSHKKKKNSVNRQPSGFVKPTRISDELAQFLGKSHGTEMARTDVSKEINAYIRSNGLQDKTNGRKINADSKLASLLKLSKDDELTYFNLQRYMKHHFIKSDTVATA